MYDLQFTRQGSKDLRKLPKSVRSFIVEKLQFYMEQPDPLIFAKPLVNLPPTTHRFRIRQYRASFFVDNQTIYIERVQLRGKAYR